jgi:hypothetical protein
MVMTSSVTTGLASTLLSTPFLGRFFVSILVTATGAKYLYSDKLSLQFVLYSDALDSGALITVMRC